MTYASLKQYPPERPALPDAMCSPCGVAGSIRDARWTVLGYDERGTFAEYVCSEHLAEIRKGQS